MYNGWHYTGEDKDLVENTVCFYFIFNRKYITLQKLYTIKA